MKQLFITLIMTTYWLYHCVKALPASPPYSSPLWQRSSIKHYNPHCYSSLILYLVCRRVQTVGADIEVPNQPSINMHRHVLCFRCCSPAVWKPNGHGLTRTYTQYTPTLNNNQGTAHKRYAIVAKKTKMILFHSPTTKAEWSLALAQSKQA